MFESSVTVENESFSSPRCEKMDLKIIQNCWKGFKNAGKPKNLCELKDFSEEQQEV